MTYRLMEPRLRAAADDVPRLRAQVAGLSEAANVREGTLSGESDALAAAALQSEIEKLAAAAGVAISSTEGLAAEPRANYRRVGLRISVSGTYATIIKLLDALETTKPPLVLDDLQIHGKPLVAGSNLVPQLDASFSAFGFRNSVTPASTMP